MKLRNLVSTLALVGLLTVGCAQLNADSDTDIVATEASAECTAGQSACSEAKKAECAAAHKAACAAQGAECKAAKNDADGVN